MAASFSQGDGFILLKLDQAGGIPISSGTPAATWGMLSSADQTRLAAVQVAQVDLYLPTSCNQYEAASAAGAAYPVADGEKLAMAGLAQTILAALFLRSTGAAFTTAVARLAIVTVPGGAKPNP